MTSKDLSIFNSLRPFSVGFDDMFDQFESMLSNGGLSMQSNYPPYNIRKTGKDKYSIEVLLLVLTRKMLKLSLKTIY
jgi:molecular chaperone IbpA